MNETSRYLWEILFGGIALGYLTYGRRQRAIVPLLSGVALLVLPYFVTSDVILLGSGVLSWFYPILSEFETTP